MPNELIVTNDEDELESCHSYVCVRASVPGMFDDDLYDFCTMCGEKVRYRPGGPTTIKKVCLECVSADLEKAAEKGELQIRATPKTMREFKDKTRKKD
jgi:hypothetical protein